MLLRIQINNHLFILMCRIVLLVAFFILINSSIISYAVQSKVGSITGLPIPRFVVIKSKDTNMRSGPGMNYPSKINYKCMFMPVEVQDEFENWRLARDINGNKGWIHEAMLDGRRYIQIVSSKKLNQNDTEVLIFRLPDLQSKPIARIAVGSVGKLLQCTNQWCKVSFGASYKGWAPKNKLWGVYQED
jgi:SH3-like domain-containing protein